MLQGMCQKSLLLATADFAYLDRKREPHILNFMYKNKEKEELMDIKNVYTRSRAALLFKMVIPSCVKYKNGTLYHSATSKH